MPWILALPFVLVAGCNRDVVFDGRPILWFADHDGDGFGSGHWDDIYVDVRREGPPPGKVTYVDNNLDCLDRGSYTADLVVLDGVTLDPREIPPESVHPEAPELCDFFDNDCDTGADDDAIDATDYFRDDDEDGYGDEHEPYRMCAAHNQDGIVNDLDCNDNDANVHPDAVEVCDGIDNDCSNGADIGAVDANTYYADADGDGFGDPGAPARACSLPQGHVVDATDCNDADPNVNPDATEDPCVYGDENCDPSDDTIVDGDGDGYDVCAGDCDDSDSHVNPGQPEIPCNGIDEDCSGTDEIPDDDGDGYHGCGQDCDDDDASVYPGAPEIPCNGIDEDCSGADETPDVDGDGYACDDCDDADPDIHPGAPEICNGGIDDDCDPATAENADGDGDGEGPCDGDCDDTDPDMYGADRDSDSYSPCDGDCDDTDPSVFPEDQDGDGVGLCDEPRDCDDNDPDAYPGAIDADATDGLDKDCDGADCVARCTADTCFTLCPIPFDWELARDACWSAGHDDLAWFSDRAEQDQVELWFQNDTFPPILPDDQPFLSIGIKKDLNDTWPFVYNGQLPSYDDWVQGFPTESGKCVFFDGDGWVNFHCDVVVYLLFLQV